MQLKIKSQIQVESEKHLEKLIKLFNESNEIFMVEGDTITLYYNMTDRAKDDVDFVTMLLELNDTINGVVKKKSNTDEENSKNIDEDLDYIADCIFRKYRNILGTYDMMKYYTANQKSCVKREQILSMVNHIIEECGNNDERFNKATKALNDIARTIYDDYYEFFKPREFLEFYSNKDSINTKRKCILFMVQYIIDEKGKRIEEKDKNNSILQGNVLDSIVECIDELFPNINFSLKYSRVWDIEEKLFNIKLRLKKINDKIQEYSYELDERNKYYSEIKDDYDKSTAAYRELNSSYNKLVKEHEELKKMKISSIHKTEKEMIDIKLNDFLHSMGLDKEDLIHDVLGGDDPIIKVRRLF